jgi:2',3'-cyclic-nucleotide 2'-phosphodiesterase (5'-nucleotidase family)
MSRRALASHRLNSAIRPVIDKLEPRMLLAAGDFKLQIIHASDGEAGVPALDDIPRFSAVVNGLKDDFANTMILSSGDNWIPGPFYTAGADPSLNALLGAADKGRADVAVMNEIGFQAAAFGNHEFDEGTARVRSIIDASGAWGGAKFPYLSANLNFAPNSDLSPLVTADGQEASAIPKKIAKSTVITVNGTKFGIVGATTPLLPNISSPGTVQTKPSTTVDPLTPALLTQLAAEIQPAIDALTAAGVKNIILMSHL